MIEILALIFLTRNIGTLAARKGLKPGTWKLYAILSWFGGEILGAFIGTLLFPFKILIVILFAYGAAVACYFLVKMNLTRRPDAGLDHEIDQIGTSTHSN